MGNDSLARSLVAGALAGAVEATCTCPVETIKTRVQLTVAATPNEARMLARGQLMQQGNVKVPGMLWVGRDIVRTEGVRALWKGVQPLVGGVMVKKAVRFGTFERWKMTVQGDSGEPLSVGMSLLGGVFSFGGCACDVDVASVPLTSSVHSPSPSSPSSRPMCRPMFMVG